MKKVIREIYLFLGQKTHPRNEISVIGEGGGDIGTEISVGDIGISRPIKQLLPYIPRYFNKNTSIVINTLVDKSRQGTIISIVPVLLYPFLYHTYPFPSYFE